MTGSDIILIGGGVIGLSIGWRLSRAGASVAIYDRALAGRGASWVSAGMLAPFSEAGYEEPEMLALALESLRLYPSFLAELAEDSDEEVALQKEGTLAVALDRDDEEALKRFFEFRVKLNLPVEWLSGRQAREREPLLSSSVVSAVSVEEDRHIDPRQLVTALKSAFTRRGGILHEHSPVKEIRANDKKVTAIAAGDGVVSCAKIVLAAGAWSSKIEGLPQEACPVVRPIKGQIITLESDLFCRLSHIIRAPEAYLVPKPANRLLVGATSEEMGFDENPTAGGVMELLQGAYEAVPSMFDCHIGEIQVGLRPGTLDNRPILGQTSLDGLYVATGHFRNGILLTPVTADAMCRLMAGEPAEILAPFSPDRFREAPAAPKMAGVA